MSFNNVSPGKDIPNDFNVIIEIPAQSDPVKYEADKETGMLHVDRFVGTGMRYPANYGFIPQTLSDDVRISSVRRRLVSVANALPEGSCVSVDVEGRVLIVGTPAEVKASEAVLDAYLGRPDGGA